MKITVGFDKYAIYDRPVIINSWYNGIVIIRFCGVSINILKDYKDIFFL